jgi:hypothetical protein
MEHNRTAIAAIANRSYLSFQQRVSITVLAVVIAGFQQCEDLIATELIMPNQAVGPSLAC